MKEKTLDYGKGENFKEGRGECIYGVKNKRGFYYRPQENLEGTIMTPGLGT